MYGFELKEIKLGLNEENKFGNARDVKFEIAANNPGLFPVDVNYAGREELLRVPGIGPKGAERILKQREQGKFKEFKEKAFSASLEEVKADVRERDLSDMTREIAPLRKAEDAIVIDTTNMTVDEVVERILEAVRGRK